MKFTGEFFVPHSAEHENYNTELEIEHKQRYLSILDLVAGKKVLDIASGEGYGSSLLSSKASQVTGIDINPDLVEHAFRKYSQDNLRFLTGSVEQIPLDSNSIDIVVSFETLEHVDADTQKQFIAEVKRVLNPGGVFIVSTPNRQNYTDRYNQQNRFHLHELYEGEFEALLKTHFGQVRIYDQGLEVTSVILNKEDYLSKRPMQVIPVNNGYHFEGKYLIGLCSDQAEGIPFTISSIVPESEKSYFQLIDRILELQREVEELGTWGTRSAEEVQTLLQERSIAMESLEKAREDINSYVDAIGKMEEDLAQTNHKAFLLEAELETIQLYHARKQVYSLDLDNLTSEVLQLREAATGRTNKSIPSHSSQEKNGHLPPAETSSILDLQNQVSELKDILNWYQRTYEERSMLGLIKQKISSKFKK